MSTDTLYKSYAIEIKGELIHRGYTISSSPSRPYSIVVTIKRIEGGLVSNYLAESLLVGDTIMAIGPDGVFNLVDIPARKFLFLSAGSGNRPLYSMTRWLTDTKVGADIACLHCAKSPDDLIFRADLDKVNQNNPKLSLRYILEPGIEHLPVGQACREGRVNGDNLAELVSDFKDRTVFVCGQLHLCQAFRLY